VSRNCIKCGKEFFKSSSCSRKAWILVKYCSMQCRKNEVRKCKVCSKEFRPRGTRQLKTGSWCSRQCRYSYPTVDYTTHEYRTKPNIRIGVGKRNAASRNLSWELSLETYSRLITNPCFYCGNRLGNVQTEIGAGLDRLVNSLGYTKENVIPCCGSCNRIRSDIFTVEETKAAVEAILQLRNY